MGERVIRRHRRAIGVVRIIHPRARIDLDAEFARRAAHGKRLVIDNAVHFAIGLPASELEAAGLTSEQLRERNPSLVHVWMPPHAPSGETADLPYDELLLWAWTGLAAQQPGATSDHPVASVVPIITYEQG